LEHPWTGVGLNQFSGYAAADPRLGLQINTHNEPLRILSEAGFPAFVLLVAFISTAIRRVRRRPHPVARLAIPALVAYVAASMFLNGLGNVAVTLPAVILLSLAAGIEARANTGPSWIAESV
jgi:O-antigen ligase